MNTAEKLRYYSGGGIINLSTRSFPDIKSTCDFINFNSMHYPPPMWTPYQNHNTNTHPYYDTGTQIPQSPKYYPNLRTSFYQPYNKNIQMHTLSTETQNYNDSVTQSAQTQHFVNAQRNEEYNRKMLPQFYQLFDKYIQPSSLEQNIPTNNLQEDNNLISSFSDQNTSFETHVINPFCKEPNFENQTSHPVSYINDTNVTNVKEEEYMSVKMPIKKQYLRKHDKTTNMNTSDMITIDLTNDSSNDASEEAITGSNLLETSDRSVLENNNRILNVNQEIPNETELNARVEFLNTLNLHPKYQVSSTSSSNILRTVRGKFTLFF